MPKIKNVFSNFGDLLGRLNVFKKDKGLSQQAKAVSDDKTDVLQQGKVVAEELNKSGNHKEAKELKTMLERFKKAPGEAMEKLKGFARRIETYVDTQPLEQSIENLEKSAKDLLSAIDVKKKHNEDAKEKVSDFLKKFGGRVQDFNNFPLFELVTKEDGFQVNKNSFIKLSLGKSIDESGIAKCKSLSVRNWAKYLLKFINSTSKKLDKDVKHCNGLTNREDKVDYLVDRQFKYVGDLIEILESPTKNKHKFGSLGKFVRGDEGQNLMAGVTMLLRSHGSKIRNNYNEMVV